MRTEQQAIKEFCEKRGFTTRSCRFAVVSEMLGVDTETAKKIETITRTIRQLFPKDKVGAKLEQEWHNTPQIAIFQSEEKQQYDRITGEKLF